LASSSIQKIGDYIRQILTKRYLSYIGLGFLAFLTSGGLYVITNNPPFETGTATGGATFMTTGGSLAGQTSAELVIVFLLTVAGAAGFILLERSFRKSFDLKDLQLKYIVGFMLIVISIGLLEYLANIKI